MENVNPIEEDEMLNPQNGDDPTDAELEQELLEQEDNDVLSYIQEKTGKTFKSKDALIKTLKQMDKDFAQQPKKVTPEKVELDSSMSERLLKLERPESNFVIDMIKRDHPEKDPYKVWEESEFYRNEAKIRSEQDEAKKRMTPPTNSNGEEEEQSAESKIEDKFMKTLPGAFKVNK